MKASLFAMILSAALAAPAFAADEVAKAPTAQQQKMKDCNADAGSKGLKGDERKKFTSSGLSG